MNGQIKAILLHSAETMTGRLSLSLSRWELIALSCDVTAVPFDEFSSTMPSNDDESETVRGTWASTAFTVLTSRAVDDRWRRPLPPSPSSSLSSSSVALTVSSIFCDSLTGRICLIQPEMGCTSK